MITRLQDKTQVLQLMAQGATVITPTNRLSLQLLKDYAAFMAKPVITKPRCLAYQSFLQHQYQALCHQQPLAEHPLLLNPQQVHYLWQQVVTDSYKVNQSLLHEVSESWSRCQLWQLASDPALFAATAQTRQFHQWQRQFEHRLQQLHAITPEQLIPYFIQQSLKANQALIWLYFDDYTPQQQSLIDYLGQQGTNVYQADFFKTETRVAVYEAKDNQDEHYQLINWLKQQLAAGLLSIGVIIPDLQQQAKIIQRLLQQHLPSQSFNLSLGQALADYPLVAHALNWLSLNKETLELHQANLLLRSPFLSHSRTELLGRAQMLQDNACLQERVIDYQVFVKELRKNSPNLAHNLANLVDYPPTASLQGWVEHFHERLKGLGFPGDYPLNSVTYQCYQRFLLLFDEFKQLNLLVDRMDCQQALAALTNLAKTCVFQAKKAAAPIQIMGLLESAGLEFDSLWVTGLTDQCLPQKTRLSAFIPIVLQQQKLMPYANAERELALAEKTMLRLKNAATNCLFSYPRLSQDTPNLPSPFLAGLPHTEFTVLTSQLEKAPKLMRFEEDYCLPAQQDEQFHGGTKLLANQAKCPFRAFATHRLHAKPAKSVSDGPDASERGQMIHKIMELIWRTIKDQPSLLGLSQQQLDQIVEQAILETLTHYSQTRTHSFSSLIQKVETKRLKRLAHAALQWEKQRPTFKVQALEQSYTMQLAGLDFEVRIDRLDQVADGSAWVIDYKSRFPESTPWHEERPTEPQLLFYALLNDSINTILFVELKNGQHHCKGFSEQVHELSGIQTVKQQSWQDYRLQWKNQLTDLANEFIKGHCLPQPLKASICQQCEFQNLCRYAPQQEEQ